jgi:hypothetical protein
MKSNHLSTVMPALVAGMTFFLPRVSKQGVDGRDDPGHDSGEMAQHDRNALGAIRSIHQAPPQLIAT